MKLIYFSATGNTKKVVDFLGQQFKEHHKDWIDLSNVDLLDDNINKDELCIIGVPSYGGRVPSIVVERIKHINAQQTPIILVVTYGNRHYDDTLIELNDIVRQQGFQPLAGIAVVCEHSIVHQFAKGRPNQEDFNELTMFVEEIKKDLQHHLSYIPGHRPYKEHHTSPLKIEMTNQCHNCGLCSKKCPVQAIDINNPRIVDEKKCISCMRCISICPRQARIYPKEKLDMLSKKLETVCSVYKKNELFM